MALLFLAPNSPPTALVIISAITLDLYFRQAFPCPIRVIPIHVLSVCEQRSYDGLGCPDPHACDSSSPDTRSTGKESSVVAMYVSNVCTPYYG
jgi:hypothetical protein